MQIIVKSKKSELERRKAESAAQTLRGYYKNECRDGSRFRSRFTKATIKKVYDAAR